MPASLLASGSATTAQTPQTTGSVESSAGAIRIEQLASGLEFPWALAVLPDGVMLITEKPGRLRLFKDGKIQPPINVPGVSYRAGANDQGGLMDVALDPEFASSGAIFLSFSEAAPDNATGQVETDDRRFGKPPDPKDNLIRGGAVARAKFADGKLSEVQVIWRQTPKTVGRGHFGNRMTFGPDGKLYIASGDRMRFDPAQDLSGNLGKIVRINPDGTAPSDNPFAGKPGTSGDIWSYGHRNILALAFTPREGTLWAFEMGPLGGDEMNRIQAGRNYGWPVVSEGENYDHSEIADHASKTEFENPLKTWTPVIAPSGALFYTGGLFPWKDSAIVGGLRSQGLVRLTMNNGNVVNEERIDLGKRIRDVKVAHDGAILVLTDDRKNGELLRLTPAPK